MIGETVEKVNSLAELIERAWGVKTIHRINPYTEEVHSTVTQIFSKEPKRVGFVFLNLSDSEIYLAPDMQVSDSRGIEIKANGGSLTMIWDEDFDLVTQSWYGIADADNSDIFTIELRLR